MLINFVINLLWRFYYFSPERIIARRIEEVSDSKSICDIGCGNGELLRRLKIILGTTGCCFGLDIYLPALVDAKKKDSYTWLIAGDLKSLPLKNKSFDVVVASHAIEHVEKDGGIINNLEAISKKLLIILTPRSVTKFCPEEENEENIYQRHKCGYEIEDFRSLGFSVYGYGLRSICNQSYKEGKLPFFIRVLASFLSLVSTAVTYHFPQVADHLLCVKAVKE